MLFDEKIEASAQDISWKFYPNSKRDFIAHEAPQVVSVPPQAHFGAKRQSTSVRGCRCTWHSRPSETALKPPPIIETMHGPGSYVSAGLNLQLGNIIDGFGT